MEKYTRTETPNGVFGIYMDTDIIHVRILTDGKSQPVLSMPAYFNLDDLGGVLTGRRAVVQANMNPKKALHSVLAFMQEAESAVSSTLEPCSIRYCIALMKELKMELQKTAFAQISDCVLALSVPEIITQKNVRTAMEKAGFHVINGAIFDPHIHDAVHIEETDRVEEDRVVEEIQKGYFFGEKLYRPTKVIVSKNSCQK